MRIVLDAMGSDKYPEPEVQAAVELVEKHGIDLILVGNQEIVEPRLKAVNPNNVAVRLIHAPDVLEMGEKAVESSLKKRKNSMAIGLDLVKKGEAQAFVTAGNTGSAMFNALRVLGRLPGVQRPALSAIFPVKNGRCVVLDIGANADCRPDFLVQFAIMGSVYAQKVLNLPNPRVGLLANGEEPGKGNELTRNTHPLLKECNLNFIGNVEAKELFGGHADVVVTDGFTGNVLLKASESVAKLITDVLKEELTATTRTKLGALLAKPAFGKIKKMLDPSEVGAAPLLGIDGLVFVGHGRSDARAMVSAVLLAQWAIQNNLLDSMRQAIKEQLA
ncbi:MAG: phosphate acyltransferase PlsX [Anaerolineae bacterium]|nr:phosphate acyltransferase PlsX [Anaerolineae bacterium]